MWFHLRPVSSIFNSLIKQGECKFKNISKNKAKLLCQAFINLNKCTAVLLQEVIISRKLSDEEIRLRQFALSNVTADVMTVVFDGEDANEVRSMMEKLKDDTIDDLKILLETINNPN